MKYFVYTLTLAVSLCFPNLLRAEAGPGWVSPERPTKEQALAYIQGTGKNAPSTLSAVTFEDRVVTEAEASASLAKTGRLAPGPKGLTAAGAIPLLNKPTPTSGGNSADLITPEILNLAAGLNYDPAKIYEYVRNYIEYEDYFG